jgi:tRNA(Ile)-lysidine synthase
MGEYNPRALENRLWEHITASGMIHKGETVLCAVSGGADSMCLLRLLCALSGRYGFAVEAATFDHRIRPEGKQDADFVRRCCERWGIPCHCGSGDVPAAAAERGRGLEETARSLRYAFLEDTACKIGAHRIATAHNADDNAETLLLHLLRGSGLRGLGGIDPVRGRLIRPLLGVSREEIEIYCAATHTPYVEDATNADTAYTRNYLRHQVLPLLRERNPNLLTTLGRTAESLRRDSEFLENEAQRCFRSAERRKSGISYGAEELLSLPEALQMRLVQRMAETLRPGTVLSAAQRENVLELCRSPRPSAACRLSGNLWARREYEEIVLSLETGEAEPEKRLLHTGESVRFHGRVLTCQEAICPEGKFNQAHVYYLRRGEELLLRSPFPGETITLPRRPRKAVKDLLSEAKLPRHLRSQAIVLEQEGRLAALDGFGADILYLPKPGERCRKITSSPVEETTTPREKEKDYGTV